MQYLPQYSPDLNPIEMPFSAFKAFLRKVSEQTVRGLCRRIGSFVPTLGRAQCRNYFSMPASRMPSLSAAVRELLRLGLASTEKQK